jgi:transcriptional/translational regulatory protein YebC/TACO1
MIQKARDNSLPVDTIQRAVKRGTGEEAGVIYEQVSYEGYAASGVAVIVQALTDNRNRTSAEIKNIFSRNGGSFAEPGAVSWQFERKGVVNVDKTEVAA